MASKELEETFHTLYKDGYTEGLKVAHGILLGL